MSTFRGAKLLLTASVAAALIVFMPLAAFADGGDDGAGDPSLPDTSYSAPPMTSLTEAIDTLQFPLTQLVSDCSPGATGISVEALPDSTSDSPPTSLLVTYNMTDGDTVDAMIDPDFVNSCVAQTSPRLETTAKADAAMVLKDTAAALAIG